MLSATYVGPNKKLQGRTALVMLYLGTSYLKAQFDNLKLTQAYGWGTYEIIDFKVHAK